MIDESINQCSLSPPQILNLLTLDHRLKGCGENVFHLFPKLEAVWLCSKFDFPPASEASREVAHFTERKNPHTPPYGDLTKE